MARRVCGTGVTAILWLKRSCCWTPTYKTHSCCCSCGSLLARVGGHCWQGRLVAVPLLDGKVQPEPRAHCHGGVHADARLCFVEHQDCLAMHGCSVKQPGVVEELNAPGAASYCFENRFILEGWVASGYNFHEFVLWLLPRKLSTG
eukprot:1155541-Pelagomonas_calceolata.AAC.6